MMSSKQQSIADLNKRILIQERIETANDMGGYVTTYKNFAEVWAGIWPVSARERMQNDRETGLTTHRVRIRYAEGIVTGMRIQFKNRFFNINGTPISPNEDRIWLDILCEETEA